MNTNLIEITTKGVNDGNSPDRAAPLNDRCYESIKSKTTWHWTRRSDLQCIYWAEAEHDVVDYDFKPHTLVIHSGKRTDLFQPDLAIRTEFGVRVVKFVRDPLDGPFVTNEVDVSAYYEATGRELVTLDNITTCLKWHSQVQAFRHVKVTPRDANAALYGFSSIDVIAALAGVYGSAALVAAKASAMHVRRMVRLDRGVDVMMVAAKIIKSDSRS